MKLLMKIKPSQSLRRAPWLGRQEFFRV